MSATSAGAAQRIAALLVCLFAAAGAAAANSAATATATATTTASHEHAAAPVLAPGYADLEFEPPAPGTYALPPLGAAADGLVLDAEGVERKLHTLLGDKVVLLSFIFTRCSDVNGCPLATYVLRGVQERLQQQRELRDQVRLISFSFDPAHDSPAVLAAYAARFQKPGFDWQFITSPNERTLSPILQAYDQWIQPDFDAAGVRVGSISHILRVYLIDRERRIRNIYSVSFLHADTVANDIRTVLSEHSAS